MSSKTPLSSPEFSEARELEQQHTLLKCVIHRSADFFFFLSSRSLIPWKKYRQVKQQYRTIEWSDTRIPSFLVLDYCCSSVISGVSLVYSVPLDIIIVCIVAKQGLPNKMKLDKAGLVMCFVQINGGEERGAIA